MSIASIVGKPASVQLEGECRHGMAEATCVLCNGRGVPAKKVRPITPAPFRPIPDRGEGWLAEQIALGAICGRCLGPTAGGCKCAREALYVIRRQEGADWDETYGHAMGDRGVYVSLAAIRREGRKAALTEEELADERSAVLEEWAVEPLKARWFPPRITEATHLPV